MNKLLAFILLLAGIAHAQPGTDLTPSKEQMLDDASNVDNPSALTNFGFSAFTQTLIDDANAGDFLTTLGVTAYAQTLLDDTTAGAAATTLGLGTGDSPIFTGGTYTGNLLVSGKLNVGNGALDDTHIANIVSAEDVITEVMLHLEWNSPTPAAGDSNALLFSMYDSALNETEYSRFRSVIEDPTDGAEDGAMTVDVLNNGVLEQAVLFSHDEIIMNDNGADRNFIVKDNTTAEVLRIQGGNGSIAMDGSTLFVDSANNRVGVGTNTPSTALDIAGITTLTNGVESTTIETDAAGDLNIEPSGDEVAYFTSPAKNVYFNLGQGNTGRSWFRIGQNGTGSSQLLLYDGTVAGVKMAGNEDSYINGGYFGIGNTTPAAQLDVSGDTILSGNLTVDTNTLFVDASTDRVGIGTATPTDPLHLFASGGAQFDDTVFRVENTALDSSSTIVLENDAVSWAMKTAGNTGNQFHLSYGPTGAVPIRISTNPISDLVRLSGSTFSTDATTINLDGNPTISGDIDATGQVELTGQAASTDDSAMTKGLVRDFSSVWGDVYKSGNGETDTNNKLNMVYAGDRYFNFSCYTGTAAGDGQWTTFRTATFGLTYGSGAKGQLRDSFSYKFKFDSNTVTNTDVDLWLIRGKTANATLPVASDVCFALKFAGEEDLMIAVYDGVTAHTTTIDVSTINSWFTNLASQQEFMWTWDGTTAKVYGRYRKPVGSGDNDWSVWYTIGSLTPSGMSAGTTNLSFGGLHFLQHTPITNTGYTKNYIIWDLEHTSHVITPN